MLNGIHFDVARKVAKLKTELIDLDLIRGSAFTKTKPKQSWITSTYFGIVRVCLFPFYVKWWVEQSNRTACVGLFILYALQLSAMFVYFSCDQMNNSDKFQTIPLSELISPLVMFFILGSIHSQISAGILISHKAKHLNKVASNAISSNSRQQEDVQRKRSASNINKESTVRNRAILSESNNTNTLTKLAFLPKTLSVSGLRKRKKSPLPRNGVRSSRSSDQLHQATGASAEDISGDDYSPYSTFHGQLNRHLDRLLKVNKSCPDPLNVKLSAKMADINDDLDNRSTMSKTSRKTTKSTNSSASNSISNFSTDASLSKNRSKRTKETQCDPTQLIKNVKSTICELSSSESDRGLPASPIKVLNDWPMINSEFSSSDDDDDDEEEEYEDDEDGNKILIRQLEDFSTVNGKIFGNDIQPDGQAGVKQRTMSNSCSKNEHKMNGFKDESQLPTAVARIDQSDQSEYKACKVFRIFDRILFKTSFLHSKLFHSSVQ